MRNKDGTDSRTIRDPAPTYFACVRVCVCGGGRQIINVRKFAPTSYVLIGVNSSLYDADGWRASYLHIECQVCDVV
jgi:hypothetical protein